MKTTKEQEAKIEKFKEVKEQFQREYDEIFREGQSIIKDIQGLNRQLRELEVKNHANVLKETWYETEIKKLGDMIDENIFGDKAK